MVSAFLKSILLRKGLRNDKIWCNSLLFREPFRRIPFYMDVYALNKSQYWPREEIKKLSLERFAETVKHASSIPFWKERFEKAGIDPNNFSESDIARIPILSKKDFLDRDISEYTVPALLPKSRKYSTSGSTGRPFTFYHDTQFELRLSAISERMFRTAGDGERSPVILIRKVSHASFDSKHHFFYLRGYNSVRHRIRELEKLILSLHSKVILYGLGSSLLEIARVCREFEISLPLKCIIYHGEEVTSSQRKEIGDILRTNVRTAYGISEIRQPAFECEQNHLHLSEEISFFEVIDDLGSPLPPEMSGHLIVTGFEHRVMPFIRYDTGDIAIIHEELCQCGRTLRTIEFHGRKMKLLDVGNGRTVSLLDFSSIFDHFYKDVRQYQIVRTNDCAFEIYIVKGDQFNMENMEYIVEQMRRVVHPKAQIEWKFVDSIPEGSNGKALYFIDKFEKSGT